MKYGYSNNADISAASIIGLSSLEDLYGVELGHLSVVRHHKNTKKSVFDWHGFTQHKTKNKKLRKTKLITMELLIISYQAPLFKKKGIEYKLEWVLNQLFDEEITSYLESVDVGFIIFPEYFLGRTPRSWKDLVETPSFGSLLDWSKTFSNIVIVPGSMALKDGNDLFNRAPVIMNGNLIGKIDKHYPFGKEIKYGVKPAKDVFYSEIKNIRVGGVICADLWYPHLFDRKNRPLDIILVPIQAVVPSKNLIDYGRFLWQSLTVTRAKEQVAIVASSDLSPTKIYEESDWHTSGSSFIINPAFRFTNENEFNEGIKSCGKKQGYCMLKTTLEKIREYKEYRKNMFYDYS